jgi:4-amino-4-deoxy-L-arabinose transferase-like glycosyltransferase
MGLTWGLPVALAPAVLWLLGWRASGATYPLHDVLARLMTRFTSGVHHREPFWATFVNLVVIFLPWTLLLPAAIRQTFPRRGGRPDPQNAYIYSWIVVILAVFALSVEKRAVYLLPILPFLALLVGRLWDVALLDWEPSVTGRAVTWFLWLNLAAVAIGAAVALPKIERAAPDLLPVAGALAAVALAGVVAAHLTHRRLGGGAALATLSAGLLAFYLVTAGAAMPAVNEYKSARPFSLRVRETAAGAPLAMYPDFLPAYVFYSERFIEVLPDRARLQAYLASAPRVFLLIEESNYEAERRHAASEMRVLDREQIGHRVMLLVSNAPPPGPPGEP